MVETLGLRDLLARGAVLSRVDVELAAPPTPNNTQGPN